MREQGLPAADGPHGDASPSKSREDEQPSVLTLIRRIQNGSLGPKNLSTQDRRSCVEHLTGEGYSATEIAEVLKASERTIFRDRGAIQESHAVKKDPRLVEQMVGRLMQEAELAISRTRRAVRDKNTPAVVKVAAERSCWRIFSELIQGLQRLGYLPTVAHQLQADLTHHLGGPLDAESIQAELRRLEGIQQSCPSDSGEMERQLDSIQRVIRLPLEDNEPRKENEDEPSE